MSRAWESRSEVESAVAAPSSGGWGCLLSADIGGSFKAPQIKITKRGAEPRGARTDLRGGAQ
ncbi:hypothetical protein GCM10018791_24860 [Streptomyces zaomyceticus]|nr:hypothetical protein GCM10018791_24860 [Streptomyces zaomyceticus]